MMIDNLCVYMQKKRYNTHKDGWMNMDLMIHVPMYDLHGST
jgi:hypothetical protein